MARPTTAQATGKTEIGRSPEYGLYQTADLNMFPMLSSQDLLRQMAIMSETDDTVGAMMWCIMSTMAQLTWNHVPQVDGVDNDVDEKAVAMAALADTMLHDMEESLSDHIDTALSMVPMGFSACEIVLKQRVKGDSRFNDGLYGIRSLPARHQLSVQDWVYSPDGRDLIGMRQYSPSRGDAIIPIWKLLHYRTTASMENPWGKPILKNAYRPWRFKTRLQDIEALGAERELCGLPVFRMPEEDIDLASEADSTGAPTADALKARAKILSAQRAVSDTRLNKSGGLILPSDTWSEDSQGDRTPKYDFSLVTSAGQRSMDIRQPIRDYDRSISRVAMMQFLHLGDRSTGSYSLSDDQSSMAVRSFMALAGKIKGEWNRKIISLIWMVNSLDPRYMPRLSSSKLSKEGMQALGTFFSGLGKAAGLWETDVDARMALGKMVDLKLNRSEQTAAAGRARKAADNAASGQLKLPLGGANSGQNNDETA